MFLDFLKDKMQLEGDWKKSGLAWYCKSVSQGDQARCLGK
jgi:hypothetical protein